MKNSRPHLFTRALTLALTLALTGALTPVVTAKTAVISEPGLADTAHAQGVYQFDVFYNDRQIGHHRFEIDRLENHQQVRSTAEFEFKLLFVSLYRYQHAAREQWQGGCLTGIESATNDNGKHFEVSLGVDAAALKVTQTDGDPHAETPTADCAGSFAYWDREQLKRPALVNSQTGKLTPVQLVFEGLDQVGGAETRRYRLQPAGMDAIHLWYRAADATWVQLETRRDSGVLSYRLASLAGP